MSRWVYFALLGTLGAIFGIALGSSSSGWLPILLAAALGLMAIWAHYLNAETQEHEARRIYGATMKATYIALCGVLNQMDYKVIRPEPDAGTLSFTGGRLGPWIPRLGVDCSASVRQINDSESEIVITGRALAGDRLGHRSTIGLLPSLAYPEGMERRTRRILDQVAATVVRRSVVDAALAAPGDHLGAESALGTDLAQRPEPNE